LTRYVVDASVVVKWFLLEDHTEAARSLLKEEFTLFAPDLVRAEVGNVMWKRWRRDDVSAEAAEEALDHLERLPLRIRSSRRLMKPAWDVSRRFDRSFYYGLYVALAQRENCRLVTADRKLYNALSDDDLDEYLVWVEDLDSTEREEDPK
jgi:predicted nucleic acid-binding protein